MPGSQLIELIVSSASAAGCRDTSHLRELLEDAADRRQPLVDRVLDENVVDEERFFEQLAAAVKLPYIAESQTDAQEGLHNRFPARLALRHRIFPTHVTGMEATLLTYNPFDLGARQAVGQDLRKRVHWQLASRHRILEALHQGYGVGAENFEQLLEGREAGDDDDELKQEVNVLDADDEEATVMNFVNQVFREGLRERATDSTSSL